jgi:hypothetical protein
MLKLVQHDKEDKIYNYNAKILGKPTLNKNAFNLGKVG